MQDTSNPFAPPRAVLTAHVGPNAPFELKDNVLSVQKGATLPSLCIWNGEAQGAERVHKTLHWAPPWVAILALSPLIYLVVYFIVRKSGTLDYALGPAARARKQQSLVYGGGGLLLSVALMTFGFVFEEGLSVAIGALGFFVALIFTLIWARIVQVVRIDKERVHLKLRPAAAEAFARLLSPG
jgi:tryptophan-rich sensory protein